MHARRALVVYGSETGNALDVAADMGRLAQRLRFDTDVVDLNAASLRHWVQHTVVLVAISTTGQGDLPANSQAFWKALRSTRLRPGALHKVRFASFGLGDSSYPKFNWAHRKLYNRLVQLGAQPICDRGESDEQHPEGVDGTFVPWSANLRTRLLQEFPLPDGLAPIPDGELLEPKWLLDFALETRQDGRSSSSSRVEVPAGLTAKVVSNHRLTPASHWQDVRHLTLSIAGPDGYMPGDVLTIYPKNSAVDVDAFISLMDWTTIADKPLCFMPSSTSTSPDSRPPIPNTEAVTGAPTSLRALLTSQLDIMSIPRRSFFVQLAHWTTDEFQKQRLLEFTDPEYIDELYDYTTRPRRSILEVLQEFETAKIPWQRICSIIPAMRGRQFSIASAFDSSITVEKQTTVELLVAIVKYRTVIKRIRQGVCTRYIASLKSGQEITVALQKGGLGVTKAEAKKPVVMVGPGTGVAPMRALIYQRKHWREEEQAAMPGSEGARDVLFFGCRNAGSDYFFQEEWRQLQRDGTPLDVFVAFSRDQKQKVYVQDLIRQQSSRVYDALAVRNGIVYVCGSSGKMPQAVREALIEVFQSHGSMERDDAERYLAAMEKSGRYKQETW